MEADFAAHICTLDGCDDERLPDFLIDDGYWLGDATAVRAIILPSQGESRARALLEMGAPRIYLGEAALRDSELVTRLATDYSPEQIGVYVPCRRMEVSWSLETKSNADFKVVTPSICEPAWEVLLADGSRTGTLAPWWIGAMMGRGAGSVLVRVDIADDADLNICAGLTETHGNRLWLAPVSQAGHRFDEWVRWGRATQLAVDRTTFDTHPGIRAIMASATADVREAA